VPPGYAASETARFLRFALVGGVGFLIDVGLLAALYHGAELDPFSARAISIATAAFSTWRLNRRITFGASASRQTTEGFRYAVVAAMTAALNYILYTLLLTLWPSLPPVAALVVATLAAMSVSYVGYSRFVFQGARAVLVEPSSHNR
jgi:putative flippase GtrA